MSWFQDFFVNIFQTVKNILDFSDGIFSSIIGIFSNVFSSLGYLPNFLLPFASLTLAISLTYLVLGREHG